MSEVTGGASAATAAELDSAVSVLVDARTAYQGLGENCLGFGNDKRRMPEQVAVQRLIDAGAAAAAPRLLDIVCSDSAGAAGKAYAVSALNALLPDSLDALESAVRAVTVSGATLLDARLTMLQGCMLSHPSFRTATGVEHMLKDVGVAALARACGAGEQRHVDALEAVGLERVRDVVDALARAESVRDAVSALVDSDTDADALLAALCIDVAADRDGSLEEASPLVRRARRMCAITFAQAPPPPAACARCGHGGHAVSACPKPCPACGAAGHGYRNCPRRRQDGDR